MSEALLEWFQRCGRDLPWRHARTPYRVWVAEIMLQQTPAATAIPYYGRWMRRFPDLESLAGAPLDEVLKAWEGLGYYRRARLLYKAAGEVVAARGGRLPEAFGGLLELPGVGTYTAAAIASLAFGERVLAVDGNVRRVAARLFALPRVGEREVRAALTPFLPESRPGDFNEALMDLGATVCLPRGPLCDCCPRRAHCAAYRAGRVAEFPEAKPRRLLPLLRRFALVYRREGQVWLYRRAESEMLGGLWGFPLSEAPAPGQRLAAVRHAYTHFRIEARPLLASGQPEGEGRFVSLGDLAGLALSKLDHKIVAAIGRSKDAA
ncbi:A/G-specific adenine glycosylase [soil metagenome]